MFATLSCVSIEHFVETWESLLLFVAYLHWCDLEPLLLEISPVAS